MNAQPDAGAAAGGQPGDRLAAPADAEPRKCRAVKHGGITLHCTEPEGHDKPAEGEPTWHRSVYAKREEHAYDGALHVINSVETVTWEPIDEVAEVVRKLTKDRP